MPHALAGNKRRDHRVEFCGHLKTIVFLQSRQTDNHVGSSIFGSVATNRGCPQMKIKANTTTTGHDYESWINTAAACQHLGISMPTIRRWIKAERLKPKRTPTGEYRFRRSELDSLLD